jgi:hypothetical protein
VLAAFGAARIDHRATAARLHARSKTVRAGVFEIAGLKSALGSHDTGFI